MKYIYRLLLVLTAFFPLQLSATHTVGGEINYRSLGNNQYEITIHFYRDCVAADPEAVFDDPASVGIFDRNGLLVKELLIPFSGQDDTLSTDLFQGCLVVPNDICVHTTTYRDTVTLEPIIGGYNIVYQRCCRNITVSNIIDPVATGATYDIWLTYEAMMKGNSSPVFGEWPPVVICVNEPLEFDHSATDEDGDSLVYKLCAPLSGASLSNPMPQPPNNPPYDTVFWEDNYDVNTMLGILGDPLTIDPSTGLLTANPGIMGQFVVGVCVEEFDKSTGELLSRVRRDFEFNVVVCQEVVAAFSAPELNCEGLTVDFSNESQGASSYEWYFDWPSTELSSTEVDPSFTFPDTGTYEVALIANPGTVCPDTIFQTIKLSENTLDVDFDIEVFNCPDTAIISTINLTQDSLAEIIEYRWELRTEELKIASGKESPVFKIPLGSKGTITLVAKNSNNCELTVSKPFELTDSIPPDYLEKTVFEACVGDSITLTPLSSVFQSWNFRWQPAGLFDDPTSATPRILVSGDTSLTLELIAPDSSCSYTEMIQIKVAPTADLAFEAVPDCDGLTITFDNQSVGGTSFLWDFGVEASDSDTSSAFSPTYTYDTPGDYIITLTSTEGDLCPNTLSQTITVDTAQLIPAFEVQNQDCATGSITLALQDVSISNVGAVDSWNWQLSDGQNSTDAKPSFTFTESQTINVELTIRTENGCGPATTSREIDIRLLEDFPAEDTVYLCAGVPTQYMNGVEGFEYNWEPNNGLDDNTSFEPIITLTESQTYNVIIKIPGEASCNAQQKITAIVTPPIELGVQGGGLICEPTARLVATTSVEASIEWRDDEGTVIGTGNILEFVPDGVEIITATAIDTFGCTEMSKEIEVIEGAINVELPDKLAVCAGDSLFLDIPNLDVNDTLNYFWTSNTLSISEPNSSSPTLFSPGGMHELYVDVSNQLGCALLDTISVIVIDSAISADIGFTFELLCDGRTVVFQNTGTDKLNYKWDFGVANTTDDVSTDFSPSYTYTEPGDYTVRLIVDHENVEDCTDTISQVISIPQTGVIADFNFNIDICTEELTQISFFDQSVSSIGEIVAWNWDFGPFGSSTEQNPILELSDADSVIAKLTIETDEDCSVMVEKIVIVRFPTIEFMDGDTVTICKGESITLNQGGDSTQLYSWSPVQGLDLSNPASPIASPDQTTTYTLTASTAEAEACTATRQITVEVIDLIIGGTPDTLICTSEEISLQVTTLPDVNVEWFSDNNLQEKIGEGTAINVTPQEAVNVYYFSAKSDSIDCEVLDSIQVRVFDLLPLVGDTMLQICYNTPTPLNPGGFPEFTYTWSPATGLDDPNSHNPVATLTEDITYSVTITDEDENCMEVREVQVTVFPDIGLDAMPDTLICEMGELEITATVTRDFPIEWYSDRSLTDNIGTGTAITVMPTDARTTYYAAVTDDNDCTQIDSTTVIVFNKDVGLEDTLITVCFGEMKALNPNGKPEYEYQWSPADGLDDASSHNPIFSGTMDQTYTVTVMDVDGLCMLTKEIRVIVTPDIGLDAMPDTLICEMGELEITATVTRDFPIEWYSDRALSDNIGTGTAITVMPTDARTTYYAAVTDDNDCTQIDSTTVIVFNKDVGLEDTLITVCFGEMKALNPNGKPEYEYEWSPADGLDDASSHNPIFSGTMDQTYTVTVMDVDGLCMLTKEIRVIVTPDIGLDAMPDTLICEMGELEITATVTRDFPIEWYSDRALTDNIGTGTAITVMPTDARTTYYAAVTDDNDCTQIDSTTVIVFNKDVGLEDTLITVCFGEMKALNPNGKPEYEYQWSPADGLDDASSHNPIFSGTMDQTYTVTVMDVDGLCMLTKEIRVIVTPDIGLDAMPDTLICEMGELEITATVTRDFPIEWYSDRALTDNIGTGTAITVMPTDARTTYYAAVTDDNDCTQIDSTTVIVFNKDVGLEDTLITVCFGEMKALNPNGKPEYEYQWSPADGLDDASSHNPIFSGTMDQTYTVTVMDVDGLCMLTKEIRVIVTPDIGLGCDA
jgi:PKD repeat protein